MSPGPQKQFDPTETLEKAMHVFWQHGYAGSSMSQLMAEMCIGKKSLYDTYGNKRELFLKALDLYGRQSLERVRETLNRPGSPLGNLKNLFQSFHEGECRGCFFGTNMADFDLDDPQVSQRFCQHLKNFEKVVENAVVQAQQAGEVSSELDAGRVSRLLSCLGQGTALVGRVGQCSQRQQDALKAAFELLQRSPG
jgi:TetR/AcrR family transcriptional regulator, transcriptional repressor for nem operon